MSAVPGLSPHGDGARLELRVQPGARRPGLVARGQAQLRLAVTAPPEDGRANAAAIEFLAELLELRPSAVELVRGHSSRNKVFHLALPHEHAHQRLSAWLASPADR